jgi:hypothetical protein
MTFNLSIVVGVDDFSSNIKTKVYMRLLGKFDNCCRNLEV